MTLPVSDHTARTLRQVAQAIASADALLITAGAGMSADSGLPVFRGNEGFWRAYPPLAAQRISFERMAQPQWFADRPRMAWAFYGHRLQLYREAIPHPGYDILRRWASRPTASAFVVTSNVDGQFRKAGFAREQVAEPHGSIHRLQCQQPCTQDTWDTPDTPLDIDLTTFEARGELPRCARCGAIARPNILMFNDADWVDDVTREQMRALDRWMPTARKGRLVVLEIGAGTAVPTIRRIGERAAERNLTTLVRINPDAHPGEEACTVVPLPALQALQLIDEAMPQPAAAPRRRKRVVEKTSTVNYIDLRAGTLQAIEPNDIPPGEIEHCLQHWRGEAQRRLVPLPDLRGLNFAGYTMHGQVVRTNGEQDGPAGAALLQIRDVRGELVSSTGFALRAREGGYLWRRLLQEAKTPLQPVDYPREPWIARRLEPAAGRNAAMLSALAFVEYAIGVSWLRARAAEEPIDQ